jgi:hypothetical protein
MQIWRARPGWPNRADEDAAIRHMGRRRRDLLTPGFQAVPQLPIVERPQLHCTCACPQVARPGNRKKEHIRWQSQKIRS